MPKVSIEKHRDVLEPIGKSIAECLASPVYQGAYFIKQPSSSEARHFATNYGFVYASCHGTTELYLPKEMLKCGRGYRIIQFTDGPSYFEIPVVNLVQAGAKTLDNGYRYMFEGTLEDMLASMKEAGFQEEDVPFPSYYNLENLSTKDRLLIPEKIKEIRGRLGNQIKSKITQEFLECLNRELYELGKSPITETPERLAKGFAYVRLEVTL